MPHRYCVHLMCSHHVYIGNIPAMFIITQMKGHNDAFHNTCVRSKVCTIKNDVLCFLESFSLIPTSKGVTLVNAWRNMILLTFLCTHNGLLAQAAELNAATTIVTANRLSKGYGVKLTPLLSYLSVDTDQLSRFLCCRNDWVILISISIYFNPLMGMDYL